MSGVTALGILFAAALELLRPIDGKDFNLYPAVERGRIV